MVRIRLLLRTHAQITVSQVLGMNPPDYQKNKSYVFYYVPVTLLPVELPCYTLYICELECSMPSIRNSPLVLKYMRFKKSTLAGGLWQLSVRRTITCPGVVGYATRLHSQDVPG